MRISSDTSSCRNSISIASSRRSSSSMFLINLCMLRKFSVVVAVGFFGISGCISISFGRGISSSELIDTLEVWGLAVVEFENFLYFIKLPPISFRNYPVDFHPIDLIDLPFEVT